MSALPRAAVAVLAVLVLSACTVRPEEITWYGNRTAVSAGPVLFCDIIAELRLDCSETDGTPAHLALHRDDAVQVNVPAAVAEKPWLLVIEYADGSPAYRTPIFDDGRLSYIVRPEGKTLKQIDLQILTVTADAAGRPQFTPYQAWVLAVEAA
jgi:hypothetical protein